MQNLGTSVINERFQILTMVGNSNAKAAGDVYLLSMPLLAHAILGNKEYWNVREQITVTIEINKNPNHAFDAWILGRVVLGDILMSENLSGDQLNQKNKVIEDLKNKLDKDNENNAFSAWAWAYLACADYNYAKDPMLTFTKGLKDPIANKLWAWVMCCFAASYAGRQEDYNTCIEGLKECMGQQTVTASLEKGLTRNVKTMNNDFPGWAGALCMVAAKWMGDDELYQELETFMIPLIERFDTEIEMYELENPAFADKIRNEKILTVLNRLIAEEAAPRSVSDKKNNLKSRN